MTSKAASAKPIPDSRASNFSLAQRGNKDPGAVDKLLEIAKTEKNADLRKRAIFWLGQSKDPRAAKLLQELIER